MRSVLFGFFLATGLASLPAQAGTISHQVGWDIPTTDWVYYLDERSFEAPQVITDVGSKVFEENQFYYANSNLLPFYTGGAPLDWVHISHDLSMTVIGVGASGVSGSFSVFLGSTLLASDAIYSPEHTAHFSSNGTVALRGDDIVNGGFLTLYGGSASYHSRSLTQNHSEWDRIDKLYNTGRLTGTVSITYGFAGAPEPEFVAATFGQSSLHLSPVPLPASGLLLGGVLLAGAAMRRKLRG